MNILYINHYAGSPVLGMEFRPYYFAREWTKMGHHVTVIAWDNSHLRIKNPDQKKYLKKETIDGISYCWVRTGKYSGNGVGRAITMFRFVGKLWKNARRIAKTMKPDVIITSSTYPLDTFAGQKIRKISDAELIHEVHDMWPATLIELGGMKKSNPFVILMQIGENSAYRHSEHVVSLLPCAKEYMTDHGMKPHKFVNIQNGIVPGEWERQEQIPESHQRLLSSLKKEGKFIVGYFGGHALSNALDILLDVARAVEIQDVVFVLVGNGVEKPRLMQRAGKERIQNVFFLDAVPKSSVGNLLEYFDCSYMGGMHSELYRFGVSLNKMYDSMMAGKPVLCALDVPQCLVEIYQCGIMIRSGKISDILRAIKELHDMPQEKRAQMGQRGKDAVLKYFGYPVLAKKFEKLFYL